MMKRKMSILLILGLVLFIIPLTVHADAVSNGTCGENATWVLDDAGKLTISGTGAMSDISGSSPWHGQSINEVVIENGISRIGNYAFYGDSISKITIPESVSSIGKGALAYNYLSSIIVSESSPYFSVQKGILYNKDLTILIKCPETKTEFCLYTFFFNKHCSAQKHQKHWRKCFLLQCQFDKCGAFIKSGNHWLLCLC